MREPSEVAAEPLTGWGRTAPSHPARVERPRSGTELTRLLDETPARGLIARGLGRSYGDAAQNAGGLVIETSGLDEIELDPESGRATLGAGVSLAKLIEVALPEGWFPAVTPGTKHVSVGGAIACDVHGKNHHVDGGFTRYVSEIVLATAGGETVSLAPDAPEFRATAGGLGLTGVVLEATVQLTRAETAWIRVDTERAVDLDDALARFAATDEQYRYSVAWIDCLARGRQLGRSVLIRGNHAGADELPKGRDPLVQARRLPLSAPRWTPSGLINRWTIAAFNEAYFRKAPRAERGRLKPLDGFFYPLDAVGNWNRLYGASGFLQYQFVVPFGGEDILRETLERLSHARAASFLAVLKRFGPGDGLLSFPIPGWTLALDIPARQPGLARLLDGLDQLVAGAGGRVYLAKDSRLDPALLAAMYPELVQWREIRDRLDPERVMTSDMARRLRLTH